MSIIEKYPKTGGKYPQNGDFASFVSPIDLLSYDQHSLCELCQVAMYNEDFCIISHLSEPVRSPNLAKTGGKIVKISFFQRFNNKILVRRVQPNQINHSKRIVSIRSQVYWISGFVRGLSDWKYPKTGGKS